MKWYLLAGIVIVIAVASGFLLLRAKTGAPGSTTTSSTTFPVSNGSTGTNVPGSTVNTSAPAGSGTKNVASWNGGTITAKDFLQDVVTMQDPNNPGDYYLAGPYGAKASDYSIIYYSDTGSFNVALTAEPIGQSRKDAENFLQTKLGLAQDQMCQLKYYVGTTQYVNEIYGGESLGFSFCPGAVPLPN